MKTLLLKLKAHKFLALCGVLLLIGVLYYSTRPPQAPAYETALVKQGDVIQEVSVTGRVNSVSEVELAFEKGGRVISVQKAVGAKVANKEVLVRLDASEPAALRSQAEANLAYETANLAQLKQGSRREDIAVSESNVASAALVVHDAQVSLFDKLQSGVTVADDAIFNKTDNLFENPRTISPRAIFPIADQKLVTSLEQSRAALTLELSDLPVLTFALVAESSVDAQKQYFVDVKKYLDDLASAINGVLPSSRYSQTLIDGWKADVSLSRTSVNAAISAVLVAEQAERSARSALLVASNQLLLKKAGPTREAVNAQEAKIVAMRATLENYDAQIAKMSLRAPFDGVITRQDAKLGQTVTPNVPVLALMGGGTFQIEANVPEVDIAKISLGDKAKVTLDAYGADVAFPASVTAVDPAETILEGVSTYKVTLQFDQNDARIRSGMTANIDISTDKKEGVLSIPLRAVTTRDEKKYVRVPDGQGEKEVEVTLGLRGSDGNIEVLSGLTLGQSVITFSAK